MTSLACNMVRTEARQSNQRIWNPIHTYTGCAALAAQEDVAHHQRATAYTYPEKPNDFPKDMVSDIAWYAKQNFTWACRLPRARKLAIEGIIFFFAGGVKNLVGSPVTAP